MSARVPGTWETPREARRRRIRAEGAAGGLEDLLDARGGAVGAFGSNSLARAYPRLCLRTETRHCVSTRLIFVLAEARRCVQHRLFRVERIWHRVEAHAVAFVRQ